MLVLRRNSVEIRAAEEVAAVAADELAAVLAEPGRAGGAEDGVMFAGFERAALCCGCWVVRGLRPSGLRVHDRKSSAACRDFHPPFASCKHGRIECVTVVKDEPSFERFISAGIFKPSPQADRGAPRSHEEKRLWNAPQAQFGRDH